MKKLIIITALLGFALINVFLTGCNSVDTDYKNKVVVIDANLLGVDLQTGFDPTTGTPLPKLQMGEIDATYITIPLDSNKDAEISVENHTNSIWGGNDYLQRKITIKTETKQLTYKKEIEAVQNE